jgi:hypothetical protein
LLPSEQSSAVVYTGSNFTILEKKDRGLLGEHRGLIVPEIDQNKSIFSEEENFMKTCSLYSRVDASSLPFPSQEVMQLLKAMVLHLRIGGISFAIVEKDLKFRFPHGILEDSKDIRTSIQLSGRPLVTTAEVIILMNYLEHFAFFSYPGMKKFKKIIKSYNGERHKCWYWIDLICALSLFGGSSNWDM